MRADTPWRRLERYLEAKLLWSRLFRATSYLRSALWIIPFIAIVLVLAITPPLRALDELLGWRISALGTAGAQSLYETTITLTLSFLVFTFGSLLVAIQVAGGQLTPRVIATILLRDNVVRYSVGIFVFTLLFAVMALNRVEGKVWDLATIVTSALAIACMAMFLFLIDHAARLMRPVSIVAHVGDEGIAVIEAVYPLPAPATASTNDNAVAQRETPLPIVAHERKSEIVLAVDLETLVDAARRADGVIEFVIRRQRVRATQRASVSLFLREIIRGGVAIPVAPNTVVQRGDVLRVTGPEPAVLRAQRYLGTAVMPSSSTDLVVLGLCIVAGGLIGVGVVLPLGSLRIALGTSVGTLIVGLLAGYVHSRHPVFGRIPDAALSLMTSLGLAAFVGMVGIGAGPHFLGALRDAGLQLFLGGVVVTTLPLVFGLYFGRYVLKLNPLLLLGGIAGAQTMTAAMAAVQERSGSTVPVLGYSGTVAIGHILLTTWGTIIVRLVT